MEFVLSPEQKAMLEVPREYLVLEGNGLKTLMTAFNTQRCLDPSISLGLAEGALDGKRIMKDFPRDGFLGTGLF